jgi:sulfite exporter TauE/SafE
MNFAVARILLYILAGALMRAGWINSEIANFIRVDGDVQAIAGAAVAAIGLAWWRIAKQLGWRT